MRISLWVRKSQRDEFRTSEVTMQMYLLCIIASFPNFCISSSHDFNTEPAYTLSDSIKTTQKTPTTITTNQDPKTLHKPNPETLRTSKFNTINLETPQITSSAQDTSSKSPSKSGTIDEDDNGSNAKDVAMSHTKWHSPQNEQNHETGTMSSVSYKDIEQQYLQNTTTEGSFAQEIPTSLQSNNLSQKNMLKDAININGASENPMSHTRFLLQKETSTMTSVRFNDIENTSQLERTTQGRFPQGTPTLQQSHTLSQEKLVEDAKNINGASEEMPTLQQSNTFSQKDLMDDTMKRTASDAAMGLRNTKHTTMPIDLIRFTSQIDNTQEKMTNVGPDDTSRTFQTILFNRGTTSGLGKDRLEQEADTMRVQKYGTIATQTQFANTHDERGGTRGTEETYNSTDEHRDERSDTWATSQNTVPPTITPAIALSPDTMITNGPDHSAPAARVNNSTTQQNLYESFQNTDGDNNTVTNTSNKTVNISNNQIIPLAKNNQTLLNCMVSNPDSKSRQSRTTCFITVWALAMTAAVFLGVNIFLCVSLSIVKKRTKRKEKRGQSEKQSLWADPKASVQERVEFWYVNGSTLEADRKEKERHRKEKMKRRGQNQENDENSLWIQPRVTVDDIAEFWDANRHTREERTQDT